MEHKKLRDRALNVLLWPYKRTQWHTIAIVTFPISNMYRGVEINTEYLQIIFYENDLFQRKCEPVGRENEYTAKKVTEDPNIIKWKHGMMPLTDALHALRVRHTMDTPFSPQAYKCWL